MKYSIAELDKILDILKERKRKADDMSSDIFFGRVACSDENITYWDLPEYKAAEETSRQCGEAINKIHDLFAKTVEDFIKEEIKIK